jgi:hypothetical protein
MAKYVKIPVEVDAIQYKEGQTTWKNIVDFLGDDIDNPDCYEGDWIVKEKRGYNIYSDKEFIECFKEVL